MGNATYQTVGTLALKRGYEQGPRLAYHARRSRAEIEAAERRRTRSFMVGLALCLAFVFSLGFVAESLIHQVRGGASESVSYETHCVATGETLWSIAQSCRLGSMRTEEVVAMIRSHNQLETSLLAPGQRLEIPVVADAALCSGD